MAAIDEPTPRELGLDPELVLTRLVARQVEANPNRPFLREVDGRSASYGEFHQLVAQWYSWLTDIGVEPGQRLGSFLPPSIDACALWLAACYLGSVEVPINPELRGDFLTHVLADSDVAMCFSRPGDPVLAELIGVKVHTVDPTASPATRFPPAELPSSPTPDDTCCVIYTSGSTGPAKGAVVTWAQMNATIGRIPRSSLTPSDITYAFYPMFHVTGRSPLPAMADIGGQVVFRDRFSLTSFWPEILQFGCTVTSVGPVLSLLLGEPERPDDTDNPLRVCLAGSGNPLTNLFANRFDVQVVGGYGSTEIGFPILDPGDTPAQTGRLGWLRPGYELRIVDDDGIEVPTGQTGEALIKPPAPALMMSGYLGQPERTEQAISNGWYRTGDLMSLGGDESLNFLGRASETIRRFGENISSTAVEAAVMTDSHVIDCAVIATPSAVSGEEVVLVVVPRVGGEFDAAALYDRLEVRLAKHMLPAYVNVREALPRTPSGKVNRRSLEDAVDVHLSWASPVAIVRA